MSSEWQNINYKCINAISKPLCTLSVTAAVVRSGGHKVFNAAKVESAVVSQPACRKI
jgi:hypothetical protein